MYCGNCGSSDENGNYCSKCGYRNNEEYESLENRRVISSDSIKNSTTGNGFSIAGLSLGLISYFLFGLSLIQLLLVLPAILFSHFGYSKSKTAKPGDKGLAIAALVISYFSLCFFLLGLIVAVGNRV